MAVLVTQHSPGQARSMVFSTANPKAQFLCTGHIISASLLRWHTTASPITWMGCQIVHNFCAITTPCTPFWSGHRYWWITLGPSCLQFVILFQTNPAQSQCLHVTLLHHSEENAAAFQIFLQTEEQAQTLQVPSPTFNGFRIFFYFLKSKIFEKTNSYDKPASPPHNLWAKPDKLE